jgi:hypothetical protein
MNSLRNVFYSAPVLCVVECRCDHSVQGDVTSRPLLLITVATVG